jgi:PAS domain S-box-containing protein
MTPGEQASLEQMHKLLERQLRRHFGSLDAVPPDLLPLLGSISASYTEADSDRRLVERSLELTSQELLQRNAALRDRDRERQIVFDSVPAMIFYKDTENNILDANSAAAAMLGRPVDELRGMPTSKLLPPEVAEALHRDDLEVIRSGSPKLGIVESHPDAEGRPHWVRTDKVPYRDDRGQVKGVIVLSVDITERKLAEEAVRASEERYRLIVETATEGIWTLDRQARTSWCNAVMADMLGYRADEMVGRSIFAFMRESEVALAQQQLGLLKAGGRVSLDFKFLRKDGGDVWVQASATAMRGPGGEMVGVLGMMTDITKRKAAEEGLKAAYERLQRVDKERMQFINNAAHELGTPLTPIKLQIHLLRARGQEAVSENRKAVDILERNFERLARLVKDLLDSARLQASNLKLHNRPLDVAEIIRQSLENYAEPARQAGVLLDLSSLPPMMVKADPSRLGQVFDNLLSNAVKFTPRGRSIRVAAHEEAGWAIITVRDEGAGIKAGDIGRLFMPFIQVHDPMEITRSGTGLGLYISRGILEAHGGSIEVSSPGLGHGAEFTVRLPLASGDEPAPAPVSLA